MHYQIPKKKNEWNEIRDEYLKKHKELGDNKLCKYGRDIVCKYYWILIIMIMVHDKRELNIIIYY